MAALQTTTLLMFLFFASISCNAARVHVDKKLANANDDFIVVNCQKTTYPRTCVASLSSFADTIRSNHLELTRTAVSVSLTAARDTSALVVRLSTNGALTPREAAAVEDCVATVGNSVKELENSMEAMRRTAETAAVESVQTWVSAALTDENTCMGGFEGGDVEGVVKRAVRRHVVGLAQLTSNALALVAGLSNSSP